MNFKKLKIILFIFILSLLIFLLFVYNFYYIKQKITFQQDEIIVNDTVEEPPFNLSGLDVVVINSKTDCPLFCKAFFEQEYIDLFLNTTENITCQCSIN